MILATPTLSLNFRLDVSVEESAHSTDIRLGIKRLFEKNTGFITD
jgi:hypothetical protein